jgi:dipeptidyl aminopeptidase/acylaminoacyl peptidase
MKTSRAIALIVLILFLAPNAAAQEKRHLRVDDIFELKNVRDPRISPDGEWVAYTVSWLNAAEDSSDTDIYMVPFGGGDPVRLTASPKPETSPRWSPDGRYLAFLSGREGNKAQVWLLDRRGGEAVRLTDYKGGVSSFAWSPDSKRLALVVSDPEPEDESKDGKEKRPRPIVVTRLQFKQDGQGYLTDLRRHIHVFDVNTKESVQITEGPHDNLSPVWSPDGKRLAFVSNRTEDPDSNFNTDIFVVEARSGQVPRALTTSEGGDTSPVFSPDGRLVAYIAGGDPADIWYSTNNVAVVSVDGGAERILTNGVDRNLSSPRFAHDGSSVYFLLEDAGNVHLARVPVTGGPVERVVTGERDVDAFDLGPAGKIVVLESQPQMPPEIAAVDGTSLRRLTFTNDAFLKGIELAPVERFKAISRDGTSIDAFLTRPPAAQAAGRLPTLLRIHGGPVAQYSTGFNLEWQLLAAHGYAVVGANPRGSSGHGREFSRAIFADWGNKDFEDVMAAVDHVVEKGIADPDRLGVGGWSYGGILTNYVITKTDRFKAAISGSSEVNYLANYGTDHYQRHWEAELGLPWQNTELWIRLSPFFQVEKVVTPTLVMCGADDMNVPLLNSEQLYQALRRLGTETELVIYPGEAHSIRRPSFQKDRYERYLGWYDRYLKPRPTS